MKKNRIILFGAGGGGEKAISNLRLNYSIDCIIDNDMRKHGKKIKGVYIVAPDEVVNRKFDLIYVASASFYQEMYQQLLALGVDKNKIVPVSGDILNAYHGEKLSAFCIAYYATILLSIAALIKLVASFI